MLETNNDIEFNSINEIYLDEVIVQLEKDIQMSGEFYEFREKKTDTLIMELSRFLEQINAGSSIANLLYRVDVNESKIDLKQNYYTSLSDLIWNRVFQKVWLRRNFKTGNK